MNPDKKPFKSRRGPPRHHGHKRRPEPNRQIAEAGPLRLFGVHAVEAALQNDARQIHKLLATENGENRLAEAIARRKPPIERVTPRDLDRILGADTVHQGLALETEPLPEPGLEDLVEAAVSGGPLVVLDHVTDPHNVGAVLRSAAAFGASGLIMTRRHSPPLNGVLAKSASGALELIPVALVQNLSRTLEELKEQGILCLGLDGDGTQPLEAETFSDPVALVLGAEGKGLRDLTRTTCDRIVRIATAGSLMSLNVSNAAAVALHFASLRRAQKI